MVFKYSVTDPFFKYFMLGFNNYYFVFNITQF